MVSSIFKQPRINFVKSQQKPKLALNNAIISLGWQSRSDQNLDLDISAFVLGKDDKVRMDKDIIFYGNTDSVNETSGANASHNNQGFVHYTQGANEPIVMRHAADQVIQINFDRVPDDVKKIVIATTLYEANKRSHTFKHFENAFVAISGQTMEFDKVHWQKLLLYRLSNEYPTENALVIGEFYRQDDNWDFKAIGRGYAGDLEDLAKFYGLGEV